MILANVAALPPAFVARLAAFVRGRRWLLLLSLGEPRRPGDYNRALWNTPLLAPRSSRATAPGAPGPDRDRGRGWMSAHPALEAFDDQRLLDSLRSARVSSYFEVAPVGGRTLMRLSDGSPFADREDPRQGARAAAHLHRRQRLEQPPAQDRLRAAARPARRRPRSPRLPDPVRRTPAGHRARPVLRGALRVVGRARAAALAEPWLLPERADFLFVPADRVQALCDRSVDVAHVGALVLHDGDGVLKGVRADHSRGLPLGPAARVPARLLRLAVRAPRCARSPNASRTGAVTVPPGAAPSLGQTRRGRANARRRPRANSTSW